MASVIEFPFVVGSLGFRFDDLVGRHRPAFTRDVANPFHSQRLKPMICPLFRFFESRENSLDMGFFITRAARMQRADESKTVFTDACEWCISLRKPLINTSGL